MTIARNTLSHGALKCAVRPRPYAGGHIGREVGAVDHTERCLHGTASRIDLSILCGVATAAVSQGRQLLATRNHADAER